MVIIIIIMACDMQRQRRHVATHRVRQINNALRRVAMSAVHRSHSLTVHLAMTRRVSVTASQRQSLLARLFHLLTPARREQVRSFDRFRSET